MIMSSSKALRPNNSSDIIPVGVQIARNLKQLSKDINDGQNALQDTLDELDTSSLEVTLERNWLGQVKKSSVEDNLENVYSNLSYYIGKCGEALQNTNDNLSRTLDLIKLLALVEKDLYEHLDDQIVSNNELKDILLDWFKKQGINDNEVRELLESSFQRAYTLRDRLNIFRQEYKSSIVACEKRLLEFENKHNALDDEIAKLITDSSNKLQKALENDLNLLSHLYNEKHASLLSLSNEQTSKMKGLLKDYVEIVTKDKKEQDLLREFVNDSLNTLRNLTASFDEDFKQKNDIFKNQTRESCNELHSIKEKIINKIDTLVSERQNEILNNLDALHNKYIGLTTTLYEDQKRELDVLVKNHEADTERIYNNFVQSQEEAVKNVRSQAEQSSSQIQLAQNKIENSVKCTVDKLNELISTFKVDFEKLKQQQSEILEEDRKKIYIKLKNTITWTVIGSITLSTVLSYIFSHLL